MPGFGGRCQTLRPRSCAGPGGRFDGYIIWSFAKTGAASYPTTGWVLARAGVHTEDCSMGASEGGEWGSRGEIWGVNRPRLEEPVDGGLRTGL